MVDRFDPSAPCTVVIRRGRPLRTWWVTGPGRFRHYGTGKRYGGSPGRDGPWDIPEIEFSELGQEEDGGG